MDSAPAPTPVTAVSTARLHLLERLGERGTATARELAGDLGRHENTVREHLAALEAQGLVITGVPVSRGRGRPARRYRRAEASDARERLTTALASYLTVAGDGAAAGRAAGRPWGEALVREHVATHPRGPALDVVIDVLEDQGFAPCVEGDGTARCVDLRRCPLLDLAREHTDVVCGAHHGMLEGAIAAAGAGWRVAEFVPFASAEACRARLEPALG